MKTIYIVSGPLGAGKTTITRALHQALGDSVLIEGDLFFNSPAMLALEWGQRLHRTWEEIIRLTKNYLTQYANVIIDFVVEDELPWFCREVSRPDTTIKYTVLLAGPDILRQRLEQRNEVQYLDRSLVLLDKLSNSPDNQRYLLDTSTLPIPTIVQKIITSPQFVIKS